MIFSKLEKTALKVLKEVCGVKKDERVLIITNDKKQVEKNIELLNEKRSK